MFSFDLRGVRCQVSGVRFWHELFRVTWVYGLTQRRKGAKNRASFRLTVFL